MDKKVDEYISKLKSPQKEILKKVRVLILKTLPGCEEKAAWGAIVFAGGKFYLGAINDCIHIGFVINGLTKEEIKLFEGSGKTMRHLKIRLLADIDEKNISKLLKMVDKKATCKETC